MTPRPISERAALLLKPETYGQSALGRPLEIWPAASKTRLLIFAGIHGEEPETTVVLSRALRALTKPSPACSVILAANPDGILHGTRGNANGVDLNRNFPTADWQPEPVPYRWLFEEGSPRLTIGTGSSPGSEPETQALLALIKRLQPEQAIALHAPLGCMDDPLETPLARWLASRTGLPLVADVGYPTPGSFGTWAAEHDLPVITYELPRQSVEELTRVHTELLVELLAAEDPFQLA